jgi:hypothetical protein
MALVNEKVPWLFLYSPGAGIRDPQVGELVLLLHIKEDAAT